MLTLEKTLWPCVYIYKGKAEAARFIDFKPAGKLDADGNGFFQVGAPVTFTHELEPWDYRVAAADAARAVQAKLRARVMELDDWIGNLLALGAPTTLTTVDQDDDIPF